MRAKDNSNTVSNTIFFPFFIKNLLSWIFSGSELLMETFKFKD
jgi:hypothetical protein